MLELGPGAEQEHETVGKLAVEMGFNRVWAVGQWAETVVRCAREAGLTEAAAFETSDECAAAGAELLEPESLVLI